VGSIFSREEVKASIMPLINEPVSAIASPQSQISNSPIDYDKLFEYATKSPEAFIPMWTIVSDVISDGYHLESYDSGTGRNKKKNAEKFLRDNFFNSEITPALLWDTLITGDGYLYTPRLTEKDIKSVVSDVVDYIPVYNKSFAENYVYNKYAMDLSFGATDLVPIASSSVKIYHDKHQKVLSYQQRVGDDKVEFNPDEIVHFKLVPLNGKVYGFTPMKTILSELSILSDAKDVIGYSFENGGSPPQILTLEDKDPNSPDFKNLEQQLKRWKSLQNRNRPLLGTGKISVQDMGKSAREMMYQELIDTFTRVCIMVWGVPPSKMGLTSDKSGAYDSGLATEGYYRRISNLQDWFYERLNWELMIPQFGVQIIPNKTYKQDEVRETQVLVQKVQAAESMIMNGWVKPEYVTEVLLSIPDKYKGDGKRIEKTTASPKDSEKVNKDDSKKEVDNLRSDTQKDKIPEIKSEVEKTLDELEYLRNKSLKMYERYNEDLEEKSVRMTRLFEDYRDSFVDETKKAVSEEVKEIQSSFLNELRDLRNSISDAVIGSEKEGS